VADSIFSETIARYREAFRQHGNSPASLFWPKGRQPTRFTALTRHFQNEPRSVLDYGCGLAHLKPFLAERFPALDYHGADIVPEFIDENRRRYPDATFLLVKGPADIVATYDYAVMSGVFNLRYDCSESEHRSIIRDSLRHLFKHVRVAMSVDFMTDQVDYQQDGAYHQNVMELYQFARDELSRRIVIDQSYMPYEFCMTVFSSPYPSEAVT
jgi:SAM-dependent methyltransferase